MAIVDNTLTLSELQPELEHYYNQAERIASSIDEFNWFLPKIKQIDEETYKFIEQSVNDLNQYVIDPEVMGAVHDLEEFIKSYSNLMPSEQTKGLGRKFVEMMRFFSFCEGALAALSRSEGVSSDLNHRLIMRYREINSFVHEAVYWFEDLLTEMKEEYDNTPKARHNKPKPDQQLTLLEPVQTIENADKLYKDITDEQPR